MEVQQPPKKNCKKCGSECKQKKAAHGEYFWICEHDNTFDDFVLEVLLEEELRNAVKKKRLFSRNMSSKSSSYALLKKLDEASPAVKKARSSPPVSFEDDAPPAKKQKTETSSTFSAAVDPLKNAKQKNINWREFTDNLIRDNYRFVFGVPKKHEKGGIYVPWAMYLKEDEEEQASQSVNTPKPRELFIPRIATPLFVTPFGVSKMEDEKTHIVNWSVSADVPRIQEIKLRIDKDERRAILAGDAAMNEIERFAQVLILLNQFLQRQVYLNYKGWHEEVRSPLAPQVADDFDEAFVKAIWTYPVKFGTPIPNTDRVYNDTIRFACPTYTTKESEELFSITKFWELDDGSTKEVEFSRAPDVITPKCAVKARITLPKIWMQSKSISVPILACEVLKISSGPPTTRTKTSTLLEDE